jgi:addiction module RelE/StbE family toxin
MSKFHVFWTKTAERDLEQIVDYIARDSESKALDILHALRSKASNLKTMPERGRIVPELKAHGIATYRELIVAPWRMIYRADGKTVLVLSVIDARRNLEDILLDRFLHSAQ